MLKSNLITNFRYLKTNIINLIFLYKKYNKYIEIMTEFIFGSTNFQQ